MKYKVGDKVVMEIAEVIGDDEYRISEFIETEPLSTYTEPLEAKIRRQAAEITRLLAENKELKEQLKLTNKRNIETLISGEDMRKLAINRARSEGQKEAWELARKIVRQPINGGYKHSEFEEIFGCGYISDIFKKYTYPEAAEKVEAWEKAKEEIKVGDVVKCEGSYGVITEIGTSTFSGIRKDSTVFHWYKVNCTKTGRHIDIDSFLKQIGEEE